MKATALLLTATIQHANAFSGPVVRSALPRRGGALSSSRNFDLDNNARAPSRIERTDVGKVLRTNVYIESVLRTNVLFEDVVRQGQGSLIDWASSFDIVEYEKGEVIFEQGDKVGAGADFMLILEDGECSITIDGEELPGEYSFHVICTDLLTYTVTLPSPELTISISIFRSIRNDETRCNGG